MNKKKAKIKAVLFDFNGVIEHPNHKTKMIAGIDKILSFLDKNNITMAIVSNGDRADIEKKLHQMNIDHYFQDIITPTISGYSKPSKMIIQIAMINIGTDKESTIMIDDSEIGIKSATNAKIRSIYFNINNNDGVNCGADFSCCFTSDLFSILTRLV